MPESILEKLGTPWAEDTAATMKAAGLSDWNLRRVPTFAVMTEKDIPLGRAAVVRKGRDVLGEGSLSYQIVPNETLVDYMHRLQEHLPAGWNHGYMGSLEGGRKVFASLEMGYPITVAGRLARVHLIGLNSHDGTVPLSVNVAVELETTGGLIHMDTPGHAARLKAHTRDLKGLPAVEAVQAHIDGYLKSLSDTLDGLDTPVLTQAESSFEKTALVILGDSGSPSVSTQSRYGNKFKAMTEVAPLTGDPALVTVLDLFLAACAWHDFASPVRKAKLGELVTLRSTRALLDPRFKEGALKRALGM